MPKLVPLGNFILGHLLYMVTSRLKSNATIIYFCVLQTSQNYQERASYTYLLGMFHLADNKRIQALEDLASLAAIDSNLLPKK